MPTKALTARDVYPIYWRKKGRQAPFGYVLSKDDPQLCVADYNLLQLFIDAMKYYKDGCSLRQCSEWLHSATGIYISHVGFQKRLKLDRKIRKAKAASAEASSEEGGEA